MCAKDAGDESSPNGARVIPAEQKLYNKGKELELKIHAVGNTEDHIHIVVSSPPRLALTD
jgi:hypothetical protein